MCRAVRPHTMILSIRRFACGKNTFYGIRLVTHKVLLKSLLSDFPIVVVTRLLNQTR